MKKKDLKILKIVFIVSTVVMIGSILFYFFYKPGTYLNDIDANNNQPASGKSVTFNPVSESAKAVLIKYGWKPGISYSATTGATGDNYHLVLSNNKGVKINLLVSQADGEFSGRNFAQNDKYAFYGKTVINLETGKATNILASYNFCDSKVFKWTPDNMLLTYGQSQSGSGNTLACVIDPVNQTVVHYAGLDLTWGEDNLPVGDVSYYNHDFYLYKIMSDGETGSCGIYKAVPKTINTQVEEKLKPVIYKTVPDSVRTSVGTNHYCKSTVLDVGGASLKLGRDFIPD